MVIYNHGKFWVEDDVNGRRVHYELQSLHALVFCLFGAAIFFVFGFFDGGLLQGTLLAGFAFSWLYGMNVLLALIRVPRAIRRALSA